MPNGARPQFWKSIAGDGREKERIPHPHSHPGHWPQEPFLRSRAREHGRPPGGFLRHKGPAEWVVSEGRRAEVHREQVEGKRAEVHREHAEVRLAEVHREQVEGRRAEVHREQVEVRRAEVHREQVEGRRAEVHREQGDVFRGVRNSLSSPSCSEADRVNREGFGRRGSRAEGHPNLKLNKSGDASGDGEEGYINNLKYENGAGDGLDMREDDASMEQDVLADQIMDSATLKEDSHAKQVKKRSNSWRGKDLRTDSFRGHHVSSQRMRIHRRATQCRYGIGNFTSSFLSIYKSLVPEQEEKEKQKQLLLMLEKLVVKEWPKAQLHVYGSCANSFGFSNSDIDICLAIDDINMSKSDILLKLADILQEDNLENVQALTHARVPIVKMMDPVTGISCDICVNNLLAVVNTKLLRDYAQIDRRLPQLAFIVKHWAKSRGVNETYRGTLSSYAYVLMCIHFLQQRRPAILPCLQEMEATYVVTVDDTRCAYFDRVEELRDFGAQNKDNISQLLWGFFHYWAYYHDYTSDVISVRTGRLISKQSKDWTRRIGNDRHLICIEDPFEISHDLGRVVDKFTIKILREEFERAADILQYDPNPGLILFEPYVPGPTHD